METITYRDPCTSIHFDNWPWGSKLKTDCFFSVERTKRGERVVRTMIDPRNGRNCKPKKTTYGVKAMIVTGSDGQTYIVQRLVGAFHVMQSNLQFTQEYIRLLDNSPRYQEMYELFNSMGKGANNG